MEIELNGVKYYTAIDPIISEKLSENIYCKNKNNMRSLIFIKNKNVKNVQEEVILEFKSKN